MQSVQSLWSGYGEIARYASPKHNKTYIVKHIAAPKQQTHPRGWNTQTSHQRKLQSYKIEARFYRDYALLCDQHCAVPKLLAEFSEQPQQILVMQDLDSMGFAVRKTSVDLKDVRLGIKWLAFFHGRFLQQDLTKLWPIGTYWHLKTRQEEFDVMQQGSLKQAAKTIDEILNQASFQTLLHGDAKLANFCFAADGQVAAVDFQYVGGGCGMKDVAYFIGSCLDEDACAVYEEQLLDHYFAALKNAISVYQPMLDAQALEADWRPLFEFAWADFHRFLKGWCPGHWKINSYSERISKEVIASITS